MINAEKLTGQWNEIRGQVKEKWGKLTDNDLTYASGNVDQLVGNIQKRTGEAREDIEIFLNEALESGSQLLQNAKNKVQNVASQVTDSVRKGYQTAADTARHGYNRVAEKLEETEEQIDEYVQNSPKQSLLFAFGIGLAAGVGVSLFLKKRSEACERSSRAVDSYAKQVMDSLANVLPESISSRFRS